MDPLRIRAEGDLRTCKACGRSGRHEEYVSYQCAVFDSNAARAGLVLAEKAYRRHERMREDASMNLRHLINSIDSQDTMIEQLREALNIAETHRAEMNAQQRWQESVIKHMDSQSTILIDSIRAAKKRCRDEKRALSRAGDRDSLFDEDMEHEERLQASQPQYWDSETEWWDEKSNEDGDPDELPPVEQQRYDDWIDRYEEERLVRREAAAILQSRPYGRRLRESRRAYESRRNRRVANARDGHARGSHDRVKQEEGSRSLLPARGPAEGRQRLASEQTHRRNRVEAWAAGVQTPTPGPSVKREEYGDDDDDDDCTDYEDQEHIYERDYGNEAEAVEEKREGHSLPPLAGVPPAFVKREETADEVLPIAVDASDRAQVKQESEPEPDPSRIQRGYSHDSRHFGGGPAAAAEASTASAGRPQRTTRRTRRTEPYPN